MKRIITFLLLFAALKVAGQTTGYLRFDTVRIMKQNGTCEVYIINKTKDSLGLLTNVGGGLTQFKRSRSINDSTLVVGLDTLVIKGGIRSGSSGSPNSNIGSGYRLAVPTTNNIKTLFPGLYLLFDSTTNTNAITLKADSSSSGLSGYYLRRKDSTLYVTQKKLNDTAAAIRGSIVAGSGINQIAQYNLTAGLTSKRSNDTAFTAVKSSVSYDLVKKFKESSMQSAEIFTLAGGINEFDIIIVDSTYHLFYTIGSDTWHKEATTLAGLSGATATKIISNCQYPGAQYINGTWHVWGWRFASLKTVHFTSSTITGTYTPRDSMPTNFADVQVRQNPSNGYWYTGYKDINVTDQPAGIMSAPTPFGPWTDLGYVFVQANRAFTHNFQEADPFIFFKGAQPYLAYAGVEQDLAGSNWEDIQLVRLDSNYKAQGQETILVYPSEDWHLYPSHKVFNPVFLEDKDGTDKMFFAENNNGSVAGWGYLQIIEDSKAPGGTSLNFTALNDDYSGRPMQLYGAWGKVANGLQFTATKGGSWGFTGFRYLGTGDFTIRCEFTPTTLDSVAKRIFTVSSTSNAYQIGLIITSNNKLGYYCTDFGGSATTTSDTLSRNTFYQVVMRRYNGKLSIILNKDTVLTTNNTTDFGNNIKTYRIANDSGYAPGAGSQFIGIIHKADFLTYALQYNNLNTSNNVTPGVTSGGGGGLSSVIADAPLTGNGTSISHLAIDTSAGATHVATQNYVDTHGAGWLLTGNAATGPQKLGLTTSYAITDYTNNLLRGGLMGNGHYVFGDTTDDATGGFHVHSLNVHFSNSAVTFDNYLNFNGTTSSLTVNAMQLKGSNLLTFTGTHNMFFGPSSGNGTLSGTENTIISSFAAGNSLTSGSNNSSMGGQVANFTSGSRNSGNGWANLYDANTGSDNVAVGYKAGRGGNHNNSIFVGSDTKATATNNLTNTALVGPGITTALSNIAVFGNGTETVFLGITTPTSVTSGYHVQIPSGSLLISDSLKIGLTRTGTATDSILVKSGVSGAVGAVAPPVSRYELIFSDTSQTTISNTSSSTTLIGNGIGTTSVDGSLLTGGSTIILRGYGTISTDAVASTLSFTFTVGNSSLVETVTGISTATSNMPYEYEYEVTTYSIGVNQTTFYRGKLDVLDFGTTKRFSANGKGVMTSSGSITTAVEAQWATADPDNTVISNGNSIEVKRK